MWQKAFGLLGLRQCQPVRQTCLRMATVMAVLPIPALADPQPTIALSALGADWMAVPDAIDMPTAPDRWPLPDAAAAGLDDMVHDSHDGAHIGLSTQRIAGSAHAGHIFRNLAGGYLVVPIVKVHLGYRG